jgi:Flp pilus assembly protein TadG
MRHSRRGAAVVEMAVVTPLLLLFLFGIIEFGWMFMVHETMVNATREACRQATLEGTTTGEVYTRFTNSMSGIGLDTSAYTVSIEAATLANPVVTVSASVPYSKISLTGMYGFLGLNESRNLMSTCSMRKENM